MHALSLDYLGSHLDEAVSLAEVSAVIITRDSGDNLVLVSESDWRTLQETAHVLATPLNAERLQRSLQLLRDDYLSEPKPQ